MGRNTFTTRVAVSLLLLGTHFAIAANDKESEKNSAGGLKSQHVWKTASLKTPLKRETSPIQSRKVNNGGKSSESLRTSSQTLFGYNGLQGQGGGFNNGYNGLGGQFGFSPNYFGGGSGGRGGANGFNQYSQLGNSYNVLGQSQGNLYGGQGQNPYYSNNYFGGPGGFSGYPYASSGGVGIGGGAYPFGSPQSSFGGFNGGQGYYPGSQFQGQVGTRNYGFINQGFGNPAFRSPQTQAGTSYNSIPSSVQIGTGLEVGSRGFGGGVGNSGGFPSASGQNYIVGNGIGQPAFIGAAAPGSGFNAGGSPFGGMYSHNAGFPGGVYRQQTPNSLFGLYDYPRSLSSTSSLSNRQSGGASRLQTTGPNRFYQGAGPGGSYSPNSKERIYRFTTSNES